MLRTHREKKTVTIHLFRPNFLHCAYHLAFCLSRETRPGTEKTFNHQIEAHVNQMGMSLREPNGTYASARHGTRLRIRMHRLGRHGFQKDQHLAMFTNSVSTPSVRGAPAHRHTDAFCCLFSCSLALRCLVDSIRIGGLCTPTEANIRARKMFIGGLNWETTDRMFKELQWHRPNLIREQQNLFETTSLSSVRYRNVLSCETVLQAVHEVSAF